MPVAAESPASHRQETPTRTESRVPEPQELGWTRATGGGRGGSARVVGSASCTRRLGGRSVRGRWVATCGQQRSHRENEATEARKVTVHLWVGGDAGTQTRLVPDVAPETQAEDKWGRGEACLRQAGQVRAGHFGLRWVGVLRASLPVPSRD